MWYTGLSRERTLPSWRLKPPFRVVFFVGEQRILEWTYSQYSESSVTFLLFNGRCNGRRSRFTARRPLCGVCTFFSSCMSGFSPVIGRFAGKRHHSFTASFSFLFVFLFLVFSFILSNCTELWVCLQLKFLLNEIGLDWTGCTSNHLQITQWKRSFFILSGKDFCWKVLLININVHYNSK